MFPTVVLVQREVDLNEWPPFRTLWLSDQMHPGFLGRAIGFVRVARNAGTNNILPRCRAATVSRNNMVKIQIFAVENSAAVLAHVFVPFENIMPGELHFLLWKAVIHYQ